MSAANVGSDLRQKILEHPMLKMNFGRRASLSTRTIFMSPERLNEMLKKLDKEANKRKVAHT